MLYSSLSMVLYVRIYSLRPESFFYSTWNFSNILLGLIAGAIAKAIYPGRQGGGILATIILGIIGAFIGGSLGVFFNTGTFALATPTLSIPGIFVAILGAIVAIFLWKLLNRHSAV